MEHAEHVALLRDGVPPGGVWADLGSGGGAFTLALADLPGPGATIHSVDVDGRALRRQADLMRARFPATTVHYQQADYRRPLDLPPLDGVVMANALHFQPGRERRAVLALVHGYLKPGGRLVIVEYDRERGNLCVPRPFAYRAWQSQAAEAGFVGTRLLATRPSDHHSGMYAALTLRPLEPLEKEDR